MPAVSNDVAKLQKAIVVDGYAESIGLPQKANYISGARLRPHRRWIPGSARYWHICASPE